MPVRIGRTTQDRAKYDPYFDGYVSYKVKDPLEAPMSLIYGPRFFDLIKDSGREAILGLNRGLNNRSNTFSAALEANARTSDHLWALELGNEPDLYEFWKYPVATSPWNETQEGLDAANWAQDFINHWNEPLPILAAGGYAIPFAIEPSWPNLPYLVDVAYNQTIKDGTKVYNGHLYSLSNVTADGLNVEMNHRTTAADLNTLPISSSKLDNKPYILGETGFHGADYKMDATLGSAIQTVDKTLRGLSIGIQRMFYHQGTINQAFFNWWSSDSVNAPFYGAYFAALAVEGGGSILASDNGTDSFAQYVVYKKEKPFKVVLVNTEYYSGTGSRSATKFTLTGLENGPVQALRLTGPSSETSVSRLQSDPSLEPSIGGQYFSNDNCSLRGHKKFEKFTVQDYQLTITLSASEALIIYL
ncbi:hypothetical protein PENPOL_c007G07799 [Penicillium polonicum]|uniref:Beta-glucuronidase C-terminal domain-containing protein n=1 Tax=Penicillium polonicum TaxID=60169 RepID=A0A1V6NJ43_PENPO|nr:hypothetical protein PENPOL_c007G07799 [Penicillium polonicum]